MSFVGECRLWLQRQPSKGSSSIKVAGSECVGECRLWPQSATEAEVAPARGDDRSGFVGECRFWLQNGRVKEAPAQKLPVQGASCVPPLAAKCHRGRDSSRQRRCQCELRRGVPPLAAKRPSGNSSSTKVVSSRCVGVCRLSPQSATGAEVTSGKNNFSMRFVGECRLWLQSGQAKVAPA